MTLIAVALLYPLVLLALSVGAGLLVESFSVRLPAALLPALGFAALIVLSQFVVLNSHLAPLTPWALVAVALAGFFRGRARWTAWTRCRTLSLWAPALAGVLSYLTLAVVILAAGHVTFPGYLLDTTAGFHLAGAEWLLHHGQFFSDRPAAYGTALWDYFGRGHPTGGNSLLGASGWLSGQDLLWLYFPFQSFALALCAMVLTFVARCASLTAALAAVVGWIASVPALVYAYTLMGSVKELAALPAIFLMAALTVLARHQLAAGIRGVIPFATAAGGAIGALGPSAVPWVAVLGVLLLGAGLSGAWAEKRESHTIGTGAPREYALRGFLTGGALLAAAVAVFSFPTLTRISQSLKMALSLSGSNPALANDPGNLLRPLRLRQVMGIWLGGSHRVDPKYVSQTNVLIVVAVACLALGIVFLIRRRLWPVLALVGAMVLVWLVLYVRGTEWTDAKVMMMTSPIIVCVALIGAIRGLATLRLGIPLLAVLSIGVLASDALAYHATNMAPTGRFQELGSIEQRFAGRGPTLLPDFDEYALYVLRRLDVDSPGYSGDMRGQFAIPGGPMYGRSYDPDQLSSFDVQGYNLVVMRKSPIWSRPPGNFALAWAGRYYDVWRRAAPAPRFHVGLGTPPLPAVRAACATVRRAAVEAGAHGTLRYAARDRNVVGDLAGSTHSPGVVLLPWEDGLTSATLLTPGFLDVRVQVPVGGRYQLWLLGDVARSVSVYLDGRRVAATSGQSGGDANPISLGTDALSAGAHSISLRRGGGGLKPGDAAGTVVDAVILSSGDIEHESVRSVPQRAWRSLCGKSLDWIEVQ